MQPNRRRLIVIDGNDPAARALFVAVAHHQPVDFISPQPVSAHLRKLGALLDRTARARLQWHPAESLRAHEKYVLIPGWSRFATLSTRLLQREVQRLIRTHGEPEAIVFTLPFYAELAAAFAGHNCIYYVYDPFEYYQAWNRDRVHACEQKMIAHCRAIFAVSAQLVDDFRARTNKPVLHSANAVSDAFVERLRHPAGVCPTDLARIPHPRVGCTGQINHTYDWDWIGALAQRMPEAHFVFIGPITESDPMRRERIESVMARDNVHALGAKPHAELPDYLAHMDACLNPLSVSEQNHRRCPLRLFDYLATGKPILSTALREARELQPRVTISRDAEDAEARLRAILREPSGLDRRQHDAFVARHTWSARATQWLEQLHALRSHPASSIRESDANTTRSDQP